MYSNFIDLDELIVLCRDKSTKKFIQESVACYRAGAYRSCIVSTWNAVVFDFIHKLRQLENGEASNLLKDFENKSSQSDYKGLWEWESKMLDHARTKFELISSVEQMDLERLFKDRSRCAHPSMTSIEEPFEATAELARYHLRSAVIHFLQYPPVQGKAAKKRIWEDIALSTFPKKPEEAAKVFQNGPLANPRFNLIKEVVNGLTANLLGKDLPNDERERQFSALNAVSILHHKDTVKILNDKLSDTILKQVQLSEENWGKVIIYLTKFTAWESLSQDCQIHAQEFIKGLNVNKELYLEDEESGKRDFLNHDRILLTAIHIDFLKESVINNLKNNHLDQLLHLKRYATDYLNDDVIKKELEKILQEQKGFSKRVSTIVDKFTKSNSYAQAISNAVELDQIIFSLSDEQRQAILNAFCDNHQINGGTKYRDVIDVIKSIFQEDRKQKGYCDSYWLDFRKKIENLNNSHIEILIHVIDSYSKEVEVK
ncbi:hypothetical protein [Trichormus variabilis]|uniref:Uncharacterized protein n=1 Tax=Trichormus variabilis SAG 1403-4b TaxID=447716 RepID=A0A433UP67_ANAVA|nr:hypothetical protein [Trichormus variabilis]MBD2626522.1 hypothetical protein [Trichormus variabilis FACHB-164]RUS95643.1 hypothetical protein DSM107003_28190 [Trichormus variabilis SAG 1403-4b]